MSRTPPSHRALTGLLADGIVERVSHGTALLPSSQRYHLTAQGIGEAAWVLGFATPSDFVRAYPASREWLTLLIRRMDAVAAVYRLAASMSPGIDGLRSRVEFHRRGRFDATITLHDGRIFGVVRQGLALRRRSERSRPLTRHSRSYQAIRQCRKTVVYEFESPSYSLGSAIGYSHSAMSLRGNFTARPSASSTLRAIEEI